MRGLAIDPGGSTGWAVYESGLLVACGACAYDSGSTWTNVDAVVAELPQRYPDDPVNPNNLITLAYRLGVVVGPLVARGVPVELVLPRVWKGGNIPKPQHHPRIVAKLRPAERAVYDRALGALGAKARTDLTDAVGIGQWALMTKRWT